MKEQGVDERFIRVTRRRMNHHSRRFINHYNGLIFVNNIKRHFLRDGRCLLRRPLSQDDNIAFLQALTDFWYYTVNQYIAFFNDAFNMRAGNGRIALRQKDIEPLPALAFIYCKTYFCWLLSFD